MKKLENKTVFITGGISGIGKSCAIAAANEGANLAIADLKSDSTESVMDELLKLNSKAIFVACDVSDFNSVKSAIHTTVKTFGTIDVALNNAGIGGTPGRMHTLSEKSWSEVIGVNLNGVFNCMHHELLVMLEQKAGVIVNMSSILGRVGFSNSSHYVAAKHGVIGLTQSAAVEYATDGIRVNAICPGFIDTPLLSKGGIVEHSPTRNIIVEMHPMKRLGKSDEIASGFVFLASSDSSFVTGTALEMDGGYLAV